MQRLLVRLLGVDGRIDRHFTVVRTGRIKVQILERDDAVVGVLHLYEKWHASRRTHTRQQKLVRVVEFYGIYSIYVNTML